jgi:hypothetical protein
MARQTVLEEAWVRVVAKTKHLRASEAAKSKAVWTEQVRRYSNPTTDHATRSRAVNRYAAIVFDEHVEGFLRCWAACRIDL